MSLLLTVTLRVTVWQEGAGGRERPGALPGAEVIGRAATAPPPPGPAAPPRQVKEQSSARPRAPARRGAGVNGRALARLPRRTRAPAPRAPPARPPLPPRARARGSSTPARAARLIGSVIPQTLRLQEEGGGDSARGPRREGRGGRRSRPRANSGRTPAGARSHSPACAPAPAPRAPLDGGSARTRSGCRSAQGSRSARPRKLFREGGRRCERRGVAPAGSRALVLPLARPVDSG